MFYGSLAVIFFSLARCHKAHQPLSTDGPVRIKTKCQEQRVINEQGYIKHGSGKESACTSVSCVEG
jgi:hypothetical protein